MKEINFDNLRKVVINHGAWWSRPNTELVYNLGLWLPDCKIHGFGVYTESNFSFLPMPKWFLWVESKSFTTPWGQAVGNITTTQLKAEYDAKQRKLYLVVSKNEPPPAG